QDGAAPVRGNGQFPLTLILGFLFCATHASTSLLTRTVDGVVLGCSDERHRVPTRRMTSTRGPYLRRFPVAISGRRGTFRRVCGRGVPTAGPVAARVAGAPSWY